MRPTDLLPAALTRRPGSVRPDPRPDHDGTDDASLPPALARRRDRTRSDEPRPDARKGTLLAS